MSRLKPEQLDALLQGYKTPAELESLYSQLLQRMINRRLEAEMYAHLGYGRGERSESDNSPNGKSRQRVQSDHGKLGLFLKTRCAHRVPQRPEPY